MHDLAGLWTVPGPGRADYQYRIAWHVPPVDGSGAQPRVGTETHDDPIVALGSFADALDGVADLVDDDLIAARARHRAAIARERVAQALMGDLVRARWAERTARRGEITALADLFGVRRTFLYEVRDGDERTTLDAAEHEFFPAR